MIRFDFIIKTNARETVYIKMSKNFNMLYFQDCGLLLDSRVKGKECYPFKNHVLCLKCNRKKLSSSESESDD
jgi:hypothetical protein